jgi:putative nucleotidyltransferase with HDIG domain
MSKPGTESLSISSLSSIHQWVSQQLGATRHERRVAAIACSLFELTSSLHELKRGDLRLLKLAAYLHDVGRSINNKNHPAEGARMIRRSKNLPLKKRHRRVLAYMTLRHRGAVPEIGHDPALERVSNPENAMLLLAFLRAADGLDSRGLPSPRLTISRRGRVIRIACRPREISAKVHRVFARRKKFRLLEEMLDCRIEVEILGRKLRAVA